MRLVITTKCNGRCTFCHSEGYKGTISEMNKNVIIESFRFAAEKDIRHVTFTGGEPTLYEDIGIIISEMRDKYPLLDISITSNGYGLELIEECDLFMINLSIFSLKKELNETYQNVDPHMALHRLDRCNAKKKVINIYISELNINELDDFIHVADKFGFGVDFLIDRNSSLLDVVKHKLGQYGEMEIHGDYTPKLCLNRKGIRIRIKHPEYSARKLPHICETCDESAMCFEYVCAVRVYPDSSTSLCLSNKYMYSDTDVYKNLQTAYSQIEDDYI
ncbi:radical SAM protein [Butyrivibrio sp. MB2005]|uniref:radical SAM protein n=1 Tax=Butyrivibrio sp. MB2005 TaxID=1280678 RepID=UPI001FA6EFCA|nr:radical SAM protein [Butyrivibrio sp. MB2005]